MIQCFPYTVNPEAFWRFFGGANPDVAGVETADVVAAFLFSVSLFID